MIWCAMTDLVKCEYEDLKDGPSRLPKFFLWIPALFWACFLSLAMKYFWNLSERDEDITRERIAIFIGMIPMITGIIAIIVGFVLFLINGGWMTSGNSFTKIDQLNLACTSFYESIQGIVLFVGLIFFLFFWLVFVFECGYIKRGILVIALTLLMLFVMNNWIGLNNALAFIIPFNNFSNFEILPPFFGILGVYTILLLIIASIDNDWGDIGYMVWATLGDALIWLIGIPFVITLITNPALFIELFTNIIYIIILAVIAIICFRIFGASAGKAERASKTMKSSGKKLKSYNQRIELYDKQIKNAIRIGDNKTVKKLQKEKEELHKEREYEQYKYDSAQNKKNAWEYKNRENDTDPNTYSPDKTWDEGVASYGVTPKQYGNYKYEYEDRINELNRKIKNKKETLNNEKVGTKRYNWTAQELNECEKEKQKLEREWEIIKNKKQI